MARCGLLGGIPLSFHRHGLLHGLGSSAAHRQVWSLCWGGWWEWSSWWEIHGWWEGGPCRGHPEDKWQLSGWGSSPFFGHFLTWLSLLALKSLCTSSELQQTLILSQWLPTIKKFNLLNQPYLGLWIHSRFCKWSNCCQEIWERRQRCFAPLLSWLQTSVCRCCVEQSCVLQLELGLFHRSSAFQAWRGHVFSVLWHLLLSITHRITCEY